MKWAVALIGIAILGCSDPTGPSSDHRVPGQALIGPETTRAGESPCYEAPEGTVCELGHPAKTYIEYVLYRQGEWWSPIVVKEQWGGTYALCINEVGANIDYFVVGSYTWCDAGAYQRRRVEVQVLP